jgi:hypothetical protein
MLFAALREASKAIGSIDRHIATARQWLYDKSLLVPATSTLRDLCVRAASGTESQIYLLSVLKDQFLEVTSCLAACRSKKRRRC